MKIKEDVLEMEMKFGSDYKSTVKKFDRYSTPLSKLIGKRIIRTKTVTYGNGVEDFSYFRDPVKLLGLCSIGIIVECDSIGVRVLENQEFLDNNWKEFTETCKVCGK